MRIIYITFLDRTCHFMLISEHPIQITVVRKEINTSGGVVKHPKNIKKNVIPGPKGFKKERVFLFKWVI